MSNSNHAIQILSRKLALPDLAFDGDGHIALEVTPQVSISLIDLDDGLIEMMCPLTDTDPPDESMMRAMLESNYMGAGVDGARLALDPDRGTIVLCERMATGEMTAAAIERRFDEFCVLAVFWQMDGALSLMEAAHELRLEKMKHEGATAPLSGKPEETPVLMRL